MPNLLQIKRSSTSGVPASLANGELAYTSLTDVLYIGSPNGSVVGIGGARFPGTLTANQALVANSTSGINEIRVATANVGAIYANGSVGTSGDVLYSNGTTAYWGTAGGVNTAAQYTWTNLHTHSANLHMGNSAANIQISNTVATFANATTTTVISLSDIRVGNTTTNVIISNTTSTFGGNVVITGTANAANMNASLFTGNLTGTSSNATNLNSQPGSYYTNASNMNAGTLPWAQAPTNTVNTTGAFTFTGLETFQANIHSGNTAANIQISNTIITINNGNVASITATSVSLGNATVNSTANLTGFYLNGSYEKYTNASVLSTGTLPDARLSSAIVNTSGSFTLAGVTTLSGNANFTGAQTYITSNVIVTSTNTTIAGYLAAGNGNFTGSVTISGNLFVNGTTTQIDTTSLLVKDNFVQLADQLANTATFLDNVDIGLFVQTGNNGAGAINYYSGLGRIAASSTNTNPYFKLFSTQTLPNSTIIDTAATTGTLQAYLAPYGSGGAFVVNSTAVNITANATVSSTITANSLTLSTALAGTSGGTGKKTMTNNAILVGNSTNGFNELTLGTADYFLQSNGTALVYSANLDGGSF